jgi:hypothetical protein
MGGFVDDVVKVTTAGLVETDFAGDEGAKAAERAAGTQAAAGREAIIAQQEAAKRGQEFLSPFTQIGQQGIEQAGFLTDPNAQFDFLQSNPLFQMGLDNANRVTQQSAASRGRLSAGDTLEQLTNNALLTAQPLINQQSQNIRGLLNVGTGIAGSQANIETGLGANVGGLLTDIGAAQAAGQVGSANARTAGNQQLLNLAGTLGGAAIGTL